MLALQRLPDNSKTKTYGNGSNWSPGTKELQNYRSAGYLTCDSGLREEIVFPRPLQKLADGERFDEHEAISYVQAYNPNIHVCFGTKTTLSLASYLDFGFFEQVYNNLHKETENLKKKLPITKLF